MDLLSELRIIGLLRQDRVVQQFAAYGPQDDPVLLTIGVVPLHETERPPYADWAARLTTCSRHPYIGEVVAHGLVGGCGYLAVRTGTGRTLAESLSGHGPLPAEHVRSVGTALADALAVAHQAGLSHLAVRPEAIFVADEEGPVLVGFDAGAPGLLRPMAAGPYAAPEYRIPHGTLDGVVPRLGAPVDVYALAATLYVALGGTLPWWQAPEDPELRGRGLPAIPGVPPEIHDALRRATAVHPAERLTAAQLRDALLPPQPIRQPHPMAGGDADEAVAGLSGLPVLFGLPPPATPDPPDRNPVAAPPPEVVGTDEHGLEPLAGTWRIITGSGAQEMLVVDAQGAVTWSGGDEAGPFLATGEAIPLGSRRFRLLLNSSDSVGLFVDLQVADGNLSFLMDEPPRMLDDAPPGDPDPAT